MRPVPFRVIPCQEWGALPPKQAAQLVGRPVRAIFHHTAGHAPHLDQLPTESYEEARAYARAIQSYHMHGNGWNDSGHNFLVCRNGYIFEGRHGSFSAVQSGKMVVSAHCPGQNAQPGVEIEHNGDEKMTPIQREAAVWLFAWICRHTRIKPGEIHGHRDYFATSCPGALYADLPSFRTDVQTALKAPAPPKPKPKTGGYWLVTRTFYDGHKADPEKAKSVRAWANAAGDLHGKGVRHLEFNWVDTT